MGFTLFSFVMILIPVIISYCIDYVIWVFPTSLPASMDTGQVHSRVIVTLSLCQCTPLRLKVTWLCLILDDVNLNCGVVGAAQECYCFVYECVFALQTYSNNFRVQWILLAVVTIPSVTSNATFLFYLYTLTYLWGVIPLVYFLLFTCILVLCVVCHCFMDCSLTTVALIV